MGEDVFEPRQEIEHIRAHVAEADALQAKLSELYAVINQDGGHAEREDPDVFAHAIERVAALIRRHEELVESNMEQAEAIAALRTERDAQERTIGAARELFEVMSPRQIRYTGAMLFAVLDEPIASELYDLTVKFCYASEKWLAAYAPTPTRGETCQCVCGCEQAATKEDEHGNKLCEQCYNDYYGIAPQGETESEA